MTSLKSFIIVNETIGNVDVEINIVHEAETFRCGWRQFTEMNVFFVKN